MKTTPEMLDAIVERYQSGCTLRQTASSLGFTLQRCKRVLKKVGVVTRRQRRVIECRDDAATGIRICHRCGLGKPLTEYGIRRNTPSGRQTICPDCLHYGRGGKRRYSIPAVQASAESLAYLAGLIDGEGYVGMTRRPGGFNVILSIGMATDVLADIAKEFAIGTTYTKRPYNKNHRPNCVWRMCSNACRSLLPMLLPYLRVKKQQAELLLQYLELALHVTRKEPTRLAIHFAEAEKIYLEVRRLNRRGAEN